MIVGVGILVAVILFIKLSSPESDISDYDWKTGYSYLAAGNDIPVRNDTNSSSGKYFHKVNHLSKIVIRNDICTPDIYSFTSFQFAYEETIFKELYLQFCIKLLNFFVEIGFQF